MPLRWPLSLLVHRFGVLERNWAEDLAGRDLQRCGRTVWDYKPERTLQTTQRSDFTTQVSPLADKAWYILQTDEPTEYGCLWFICNS